MKASIQDRRKSAPRKELLAAVPQHRRQYELNELLSRITKKNLHRPVMTGGPLGKEIC
jgi:antitoxin component of MazEF toxin-antitoxin module